MADDVSSPPPSPFDKLPVELLKRLVELVKAQDERFNTSDLKPKQVSLSQTSYRATHYGADEDVAEKTLSAWYGRGVDALSRTNQSLRAQTLPLLFETVKGSQLDKSTFRYFVSGYPSARYIRTVDLRNASEGDVVALSLSLHHLPELDTLRATSSPLSRIVSCHRHPNAGPSRPGQSGEDRGNMHKLARRALLAHRGRFTALELEGEYAHILSLLEDFADPATLRRLSIQCRGLFLSLVKGSFGEALSRFNLEQLSLMPQEVHGWTGPALAASEWIDTTVLPSITSLIFYLGSPVPSPLECIARLAPNLVRLDLRQGEGPFDDPPEDEKLSFPHLQHLSLPSLCLTDSLLKVFRHSPLLSISLTIHSNELDCVDMLPLDTPLPPTLRSLYIDYHAATPPTDRTSYAEALAARNIAFSFSWTPEPWPLEEDIPADEEIGTSLKKQVIEQTIEWAREYAEGLALAEDEPGLNRLGEALTRVKELQVLAKQ
ncbi:hypothetical protein JCM6882_004838 [Rhodosporidiobolus microsporus]